MRKIFMRNQGKIKKNETYEGKSLEEALADKIAGEEIELGGKALLYSERKDGVLPITNIRTDRWDIAMMALDSVEKARIAKRDSSGKTLDKTDGLAKPTDGTEIN